MTKTKTKDPDALSTLFESAIRRFRQGTHRRVAPNDEGAYPVWSREGGFKGYVVVVRTPRGMRYMKGERASFDPYQVHVGWWWSRPLPALPSAPDWGVREEVSCER